jgi:EpsI family protein
VPVAGDLERFPGQVGRWRALRVGTMRSELASLEYDRTLSRNYVAPDGTELNLFVGYFAQQEEGRELAGYRMRALLTGSEDSTYVAAEGGSAGEFVVATDAGRVYVTHWYDVGGHRATGNVAAKLYTAWNAIVHGRTNGTLVAVTTRARDSESRMDVRARLADFVAGIPPGLSPLVGLD